MADGLPPLRLYKTASGNPVVSVDGVEVTELSELLERAPGIVSPEFAAACAQIVNHLAYGYQYAVISDPGDFETKYREKYAAEDPDVISQPGEMRLRNYGLPDFAMIEPPLFVGDNLVFYAERMYFGLPYRVEAAIANPAAEKPAFTPVPGAPTA